MYTRESDKEERADLGAHVMTHNLFYSGRQKPHYMEEESAKGILAGTNLSGNEARSQRSVCRVYRPLRD